MFDPSTQAFEIKYPWIAHRWTTPSGHVHKYRAAFITIWHEDPCRGGGPRPDDSCGWSRPRIETAEREKFEKIGLEMYSTIFNKQDAEARKADYVSVCYEPTCYDAIYWSWRRIAHEMRPNSRWQFGVNLTAKELEEIYSLSANPIDNFRFRMREIVDAATFADFFLRIFSCYKRFHRPWFKHPRWHIWHWRVQIHPWQQLRRWMLTKCEGCGKGFKFGESPTSHSWHSEPPKFLRGERGLYHSDCSGKMYALQNTPPAGSA